MKFGNRSQVMRDCMKSQAKATFTPLTEVYFNKAAFIHIKAPSLNLFQQTVAIFVSAPKQGKQKENLHNSQTCCCGIPS